MSLFRARRRPVWPFATLALVLLALCLPAVYAAGGRDASPRSGAGAQLLRVAGPLDIEAALRAPPERWTAAPTRSLGFVGTPVWLRLALPPSRDARVVSIDNPLLERVVFHVYRATVPAGGGGRGVGVGVGVGVGERVLPPVATGAAVPFAARPMPADTDFALTLPATATPVVVYIGVDTFGALRAVPIVRAANDYAKEHGFVVLLRGAYYGALLVMALYNIGLALTLRDRDYALYVGYVLSMLGVVSVLDGTVYQMLDTAHGGWQGFAIVVFAHFAMGFLQFFVRDFLRLSRGSLLYRGMTLLGTLCFLAAFVPFVHYGPATYVMMMSMGALTSAVHVVAALRNWRGAPPTLQMYRVGLALLIGGAVLFGLLEAGVIGDNVWVRHGLQIGSTLDVILLSFALAVRIRIERQARARTEADAQSLALRLEAVQRERQLAEKDQALQESLQRARQLQVLGQMAGGFAHGFNNILTSMMGFAELAQERATEAHDDVMRRHLTEIQNGGRRAAGLVDQLLTYSGGNRRLASNVDLVEVVDRAASLLRGALPTRVRLEWDAPTRPAIARLDPDRMQQAIVNLCLNARDAISDHGVITLALHSRTLPLTVCTSCAAEFDGRYHALQVRDTGPGIKVDMAQIFVPFYTTRPADSSGLGLSVVHAVTHECGGHLRVRNHPEGGTEFEIYLPV